MQHLPPALDVGIGMEGSDGKGTVVVVAFRKQHLISALLHCDLASVKSIVEQGRGECATMGVLAGGEMDSRNFLLS